MTGAKSKVKIMAVIAAIAVLVIITVTVALPFLINVDQFRPRIESMLSAKLGRDVKLGELQLSLFSGRLSVNDILIMDNPEFSSAPFVAAGSLSIGVELKPLIFSKKIHITEISLERPSISLLRTPEGEWNFSDLGTGKADVAEPAAKTPASVSDIKIGRLVVTNCLVEIIEPRKKTATYEKVAFSVDNLSYDAASRFTLSSAVEGGGLLAVKGTFGPLSREDALLTPFAAALEVKHFDPIASGFIPADSGVSGLFDFSGELNSDKGVLKSKGKASIADLRLINGGARAEKPVSLDYELSYDLNSKTGAITDAAVGFGRAAMRLSGDFDAGGDVAYLKMNLNGTGVSLDELQELPLLLGITLPKGASLNGGTLDAEINAEGFLNAVSMDGRVEIGKVRLSGFDLGDKLTLVAKAAGLQSAPDTMIERLYADMGWTADGIAVRDIQLAVPAIGLISGAGTISPERELDFAMRATVSPGMLGELAQGNAFRVNFLVRGNAAEPEFVPDYRDAALSLLDAVFTGKGAAAGKEENQENKIIGTLKGFFGNKKE